MSDLTDFFSGGSGGGGSVGDLSLKPAALNADLYVDTNSSTWLKSGVGESDLSMYPDLPVLALPDAGSTDGNRSWVGASPVDFLGMNASNYGKFLNDSFNNEIFFTKKYSWYGWERFAPVSLDSDGKIENPYIDSTTSNKRWGGTSYNKNSMSLNSSGTLPQFDGTDHWALMPNFSPSSTNSMPYRSTYTNSVTGAGELNTWKLRKVTGGNTNSASNGTYTFSAGDDIIPSGVPTSGYDVSLGAQSGSGFNGIRIGNQFAVTDTQILINVKMTTNYFQYYYYFGYHYPWQVHTFNKSTGAYEGMLYNNSYAINNNGGSGYLILKDPNNPGVTSQRGNWLSGDKKITYYNTNHTEEFALFVYVNFGSSTSDGWGTPIETDNSGRIITFNPDQLSLSQLENAKSSGLNSNDPNQGGTIEIYEKASGIKTLYSKGLSVVTELEYTGMGINTSNTQIHAGPQTTSEDTGHRLYIKAL